MVNLEIKQKVESILESKTSLNGTEMIIFIEKQGSEEFLKQVIDFDSKIVKFAYIDIRQRYYIPVLKAIETNFYLELLQQLIDLKFLNQLDTVQNDQIQQIQDIIQKNFKDIPVFVLKMHIKFSIRDIKKAIKNDYLTHFIYETLIINDDNKQSIFCFLSNLNHYCKENQIHFTLKKLSVKKSEEQNQDCNEQQE
ncbi:hypothetical protein SS50377_24472 [Spironucleus salmonicida]|uniref:Uncharacterized protein n=1 Tax=Spironucleus salmonicida TaxID=348837 RepID=V6LMX4_9EUKA|nr:hypothetical protein SS50377_24472 [Spironucleus salmonicida]|eukprot:EST45980.1 Hypothetical protein SS50377_13962 [Spironucleus salmonicida]